jgi:hypothetical protein
MVAIPPEAAAALESLVDDYRARCLWFLRPDYYPACVEEAVRVLDAIERYGDVAGFRRAAEVREWLLPTSSATFAAS